MRIVEFASIMKNISRTSIALIWLVCATQPCSAGELSEARASLKKWGFAYCIGSAGSDEAIKSESNRALEAYFQLGGHNNEAAYQSVRVYFDKELKQVRTVSQHDGKRMPLPICLDLYESANYARVIRRQDRYVYIEARR